MFIAVLFTIAKTWKHPKCLSTDEWTKLWHTCTTEYYSAVKTTKPHNMDGSQKEARYVGSTLWDFPGSSDG